MATEHDPGRERGEPGRTRADEPLEAPAWEDDPARETTAPRSSSSAGEPRSSSTASAGGPGETTSAAAERAAGRDRARRDKSDNMLPARETRRSGAERLLVRLIATAGIVAIGVAIAAIMVSSHSQGWVVGLVVSIVTVALAAILWSSKML